MFAICGLISLSIRVLRANLLFGRTQGAALYHTIPK